MERGQAAEAEWNQRFAAYRTAHPEAGAEFERRMQGRSAARVCEPARSAGRHCRQDPMPLPPRKSSQNALDVLAPLVPEFSAAVPT